MKKIVSFIAIFMISIGSFFAFFTPKNSEEVAYADTYNVFPDIFVNASRSASANYEPLCVLVRTDALADFTLGHYYFMAYGSPPHQSIPTQYYEEFTFVRDSWQTIEFSGISDYFTLQYFCDTNFVFENIVRVDCFGIDSLSPFPRNVLRFIDGAGNRFQLDFWCYIQTSSGVLSGVLYASAIKSLYTAPIDNNTVLYQTAYQSGYESGVASGRDLGYSSGYNVGYSAGDAVGYQRGIDASNQYSFGNLLFAVVDTPVVIFRSLFDFNVLGVNLQGFFFSLLTVAVVISVVRFILAR